MQVFRGRHMALILSVAAIAAAGCGSSSKSKTTAAPATTPATPSTPSTGTGTTPKLTASTPITDPAVKSAIVAVARTGVPSSVPTAQLNAVTDCMVKKLDAEGVKTAGELAGAKSKAESAATQCAKQLGIKK